MVRNWLFTLFYCVSELWGDVVLSLLFWGLANETTSIEDAPLLYPLFGIGANVAQTVAGAWVGGGELAEREVRMRVMLLLCDQQLNTKQSGVSHPPPPPRLPHQNKTTQAARCACSATPRGAAT